jgi:branched-chain amino acid transport system ATP-binding protein
MSAVTGTDLALSAESISVQFGGLVAVNDVNFTIPKKSVVSLIGPNGAGKTTFFNVLTGLYKPTGGRVMFGEKELLHLALRVPSKTFVFSAS